MCNSFSVVLLLSTTSLLGLWLTDEWTYKGPWSFTFVQATHTNIIVTGTSHFFAAVTQLLTVLQAF